MYKLLFLTVLVLNGTTMAFGLPPTLRSMSKPAIAKPAAVTKPASVKPTVKPSSTKPTPRATPKPKPTVNTPKPLTHRPAHVYEVRNSYTGARQKIGITSQSPSKTGRHARPASQASKLTRSTGQHHDYRVLKSFTKPHGKFTPRRQALNAERNLVTKGRAEGEKLPLNSRPKPNPFSDWPKK